MLLFKYKIFLCLFFLILMVIIGGGVALSDEKVILTTHNLSPYGSFPEESPVKIIADHTFKGVAVNLVRCVFEKMDVPLEIQVLPWKRAQLMVKTGAADGFFAASHKESRDAYAVMSAVIADQKWMWYLLKENPMDPSSQSFKRSASVGGFLGANMLQWMQENDYKVAATPHDTEGLLKVLLAKRVDAVMANNYVMGDLIKRHRLDHQVKAFVVKDKPLGVYFSKVFLNNHPEFIDEFNANVSLCK